MRVPVNPTTSPNTGQLGYAKPVDISSGAQGMAQAIGVFANYQAEQARNNESFEVRKAVLDQANHFEDDFHQRSQDLNDETEPTFVPSVAKDYGEQNSAIIKGFTDRNFSPESLQEAELRLSDLHQTYVGKSMATSDHYNQVRYAGKAGDMSDSVSRYVNNNPLYAASAIMEGEDAIDAMPIPAEDKIVHKNNLRNKAFDTLATSYGNRYALDTVRALAPWKLHQQEVSPSPAPFSGPISTFQDVAKSVATKFNLPAEQVAAVISYETAGTFDPNIMGGTGGKHMGLIQFGPTERKKYGIVKGSGPEAWANAINSFLTDRGFKSGMQLIDLYSTINAGSPGHRKASDGNGTIETHVQRILNEHAKKAAAWLRGSSNSSAPPIEQSLATDDPYPLYPVVGADPSTFGSRSDGTAKGKGFIGVRVRPDGNVSSEISVGVEIGGKEKEVPLMVPGLSKDEMDYLMTNDPGSADFIKNLPESILTKAVLHAQNRMDRGKSPFLQPDETGNEVLDMLDGQQQERALSTALTQLNQQDAEARQAARAKHETWLNSFYNQLLDGSANQTELNAAYADGRLGDYDERVKAQNIIDSRKKVDQDLVNFHTMWKVGGQFNPYSKSAQDAADAGFKAAVADNAKNNGEATPVTIALRLWQRTGILPKQGAVIIRGGLVSIDPVQVAGSASVASNMIAQNPNAFAGVEGETDITQAAANYTHYVDDLGMTAQEAATKIATENSPEFKAKIKADEPARNKFIKNIGGLDINSQLNTAFNGATSWGHTVAAIGTFGLSTLLDAPEGQFSSSSQKAEAKQTFSELALDHYDRFHDQGAAVAYASRQMTRFYGMQNGRFMKYPPAKAYPQINGSREYIFDQAKEIVDEVAGGPVDKKNIFLQPTATGSSASAFRAGKPVPYEVFYTTEKDGQVVYHHINNKVFVADVAAEQARVAEEKNTQSRELRETKQRQLLSPVVSSGLQ